MKPRSRIWFGLLVTCTATSDLGGQTGPDTARLMNPAVTNGRTQLAWQAVSGTMLAASLLLDERLRAVALANHSRTLDRIAAGADVLGTARNMVPALAATYVTSRLFGKRAFAEATFHVAVSYLAADAIESTLKPIVGRVRPSEGREPLTFRPFAANGDFHSFPSAHVVHVASVAAASALEMDRPWAFALAGAAMLYVGAQRVYRDQHWSSDVVASAILSTEIAHVVTTKLHHHHLTRHSTASSPSRQGG